MALAAVTALALLGTAGCRDRDTTPAADAVPWVRMAALTDASESALRTSGIVRARVETPLAFLVGGRILKRHVQAGQSVASDALLFELDPRDLQEALRAAEAERNAARAERHNAAAELGRQRQLLAQGFIGQQAYDRSALASQAAESRWVAVEARWRQARNASGYGQLRARQPGVVIDVSGEAGQVVAAGQALGTLAVAGDREVEVQLADARGAPKRGQLLLDGERTLSLRLREVAGSADPASRTWRARYTIEAPAPARPCRRPHARRVGRSRARRSRRWARR